MLIALPHVICTEPSEVNYRYACTTKLHVLVGIVGDVRYSGQILTDELPEDAVALAMEDADTCHAYQYGIIDEILYGRQGLVASHAANVQVLFEVRLVAVYGLPCSLAHGIGLE